MHRHAVDESGRFSMRIHRAALAAMGAKDLGAVDRGDLSGFKWAEVPEVIVEMGLLSNPWDDRLLKSVVLVLSRLDAAAGLWQ